MSSMCATCPAHLTFLHLIISWSSSLCSFLQPFATPSVLGPDILPAPVLKHPQCRLCFPPGLVPHQRPTGDVPSLTNSGLLPTCDDSRALTQMSSFCQLLTVSHFSLPRAVSSLLLLVCSVNPLKTGFLHNFIYKSSPYLTENILHLHYKAQPVNAVWGNSRCLL
jgi:hypothetical protein